MNKKFLLIIITVLALTLIGFTQFSAQLAPAEFDALRTEVAATVYGEIYSTVYWQFSAQSTQAALAPASPGVTGLGPGVWKPTPTVYSYMAKMTGQGKNYMQIKMYEDWKMSWTFKNVGPLDWTDEFYLRYYKGVVPIEGKVIMLPAVPKGESVTVEVTFDGRDAPGIYNAYFELIDNDGAVILDNIFSAVLVK